MINCCESAVGRQFNAKSFAIKRKAKSTKSTKNYTLHITHTPCVAAAAAEVVAKFKAFDKS